MINPEQYLKDLDAELKSVAGKLRSEFQAIRGSRPSVELAENLKVNFYGQDITIRQLGSISLVPPRGIKINVWDKNAAGAVAKAIEAAKLGLSVSTDGNNVTAVLSPLGSERREELERLVKRTTETQRIQVRAKRDETIKKLKIAEEKKEISEDQMFKAKEKIQKMIDEINKKMENLLESKLKELSE